MNSSAFLRFRALLCALFLTFGLLAVGGCGAGWGGGIKVPTLNFTAIPAQLFGAAPFGVSASSESSGTVTYSVFSGPATISGNVVTLTGIGTVELGASQVASGNFTAATTTTSFTVAAAVPTLRFTTIAAKTFGTAPFSVTASSASSGAITYSVVSGPATISGSVVTLTGIGTVVLGASQVASGNYTSASTTTTFSVTAEVPALSFEAIPPQTFGAAPFSVTAGSVSTGAITYSVVSGPATISGNVVTLTAIGTVVLGASQAASGNYTAASTTTSFGVAAQVPALSFVAIANQVIGVTPFAVSASSASSGAITYSVVSGPATLSGNVVTLNSTGTVVLSASQAANGNYAAAATTTSFSVIPVNVTIQPISPADQIMAPGQQTFHAITSGGPTNTLTWTATGGNMAPDGVWTSPATPGIYSITATSVDEPSVSVSTTVTVSAPVITVQPVSQSPCSAPATLSVGSNYANANGYQWYRDGILISGATSSSYVIAVPTSTAKYSVTVTNDAGSVTSSVVTVAVGTSIKLQPSTLPAYETQTATLSGAAAGISPFTYQWYVIPSGTSAGVAIPLATSNSYTTDALNTVNSGDQYYVTVTNSCGTVPSSNSVLTVMSGNAPPTILTQPVAQTVAIGDTATLTATASGTPPLAYQWYQIPAGSAAGTFTAITGATSNSYTVPASMTFAVNDQDQYFVQVTNPYGQAISRNATLAVGDGVQITRQPSSQYVNEGDPATFTVVATSNQPLTYQWYMVPPGESAFADTINTTSGVITTAASVVAIPGATSATYTIPSTSAAQTGTVYGVFISNGSTTPAVSSTASLFVGPLIEIPACSSGWTTIEDTTAFDLADCSFQLTAAQTLQHGQIVWPELISTGNITVSFTVATSSPSATPADGFALVLGDPSLGATEAILGSPGLGLGAEGIPGSVVAFDDFYNAPNLVSFPGDPGSSANPAYIAVGRGETPQWENPYFNVNSSLPGGADALAKVGLTVSHDYVVRIVHEQLTVTMDGRQIFSGSISVPPVAYLYLTASTGASYEQTVISNIQATVSAPSN